MTVRVQLFGGFFVTVEGQDVAIKGQSERRILARLCLAQGGPLLRRTLAAELWPDCEFSVSGNRLRTGLVELRRALSPSTPVQADRLSVSLDPGQVSSDVSRAFEADRAVKRALSDEERAACLTVLAETTSRDLLPDWEEDWASAARLRWKLRHLEACVQRCGLALASDDLGAAGQWAGAALDADPHSTEAWMHWFQSFAAQGRGPEAARRYFNDREKLGLRGPSWADIEAAAKAARLSRDKPGASVALTLSEADFVQRAFGRMLADDPAAAARFLAHPSTGAEIEREPLRVKGLLDRALKATEGSVEHAGLRAAALRASGLLYDSAGIQAHATWILENDDDESRRLGTHAVLAFDRMLSKDWEASLEHAELALAAARQLGDPSRIWRALAQRASVHWHMGRPQEALEAYCEAFDGMRSTCEDSSRPALALLAFNVASVLATQGLEGEAETWIGRVRSLSGADKRDELATFLEPLAGYVLAVQGRKNESATSLSEGIVHCMRRNSRRQLEIGLDYTAGAFAAWGDGPQALALLSQAARLRRESGRLRSPAEQAFAERVTLTCVAVDAEPEWSAIRRAPSLAKAVLARLEPYTLT